MAKRRRLSPANPAYLDSKPPLGAFADAPAPAAPMDTAPRDTVMAKRAPIADVASEASAQSALQELSGVLSEARSKGLMLEELPLDAIDMQYLVRDRLTADEEDLEALIASLRSRGQQTPIEVVRLNKSETGPRYGLISGWRRMLALTHLLQTDAGKGFDRVLARIIQPETAQEAYLAMVEENEIRVNLSHYERARIALKALQEGVYDTQKQALNGLFGNVARAKRSKIGSFMRLVETMDDMLRFPASISEKLGLALVRELNQNEDFLEKLKGDLVFRERETPEAEMAMLSVSLQQAQDWHARHGDLLKELRAQEAEGEALAQPSDMPSETVVDASSAPQPTADVTQPTTPSAPATRISQKINDRLSLHYTPEKGRIELLGGAVTEDLKAALEDWLVQSLGD